MVNLKRRLVIRHQYALGDTVLFTALVRDIARTYPGRFEIEVESHFRDVWANNPYAKLVHKSAVSSLPTTAIEVSYQEGIIAAGRGHKVHMLSWFHRDFARRTGVELHPLEPKGDLHLTDEESKPMVSGRYWLAMAGGKNDATVKVWRPSHWQRTIDLLAKQGVHVVQAGALHREHFHPTLSGVTDMIGKCPSSRQFFNLIKNADGIICPITGAMHVAACYDKPCVVIAGGREEPWWEGYTNAYPGSFGPKCTPVVVEHRYLHTVGKLGCCQEKGCWKHRTVALNDNQDWDAIDKRCKLPVLTPGGSAPQCLELIEPDHVVEAAMSYYENGNIPPIGEPKRTYSIPRGGAQMPSAQMPSSETGAPLPDGLPRTPPTLANKVLPAPKRHIALPGLQTQKTVIESIGPDVWLEEKLQEPPAKAAKAAKAPKPSGPCRPSNIDHPFVGGRLTAFVLCFGDFETMARQCVGSILETLPGDCLDLRVGLNAVSDGTREYIRSLPRVTKIYDHPENAKKYPLMREMFWDPTLPIATPYFVWFDDDAKVVNISTWSQLCTMIVANHPHGSRMFGDLFVHDTARYPQGTKWFKSAPWFKNKNMRAKGTRQEAPNGSVIEFASGWFWAMATQTMRDAGIPDARLHHNGGDITIGEQVHQAGGLIKQFNKDKQLVWCPKIEEGGRRGYSESFPWAK